MEESLTSSRTPLFEPKIHKFADGGIGGPFGGLRSSPLRLVWCLGEVLPCKCLKQRPSYARRYRYFDVSYVVATPNFNLKEMGHPNAAPEFKLGSKVQSNYDTMWVGFTWSHIMWNVHPLLSIINLIICDPWDARTLSKNTPFCCPSQFVRDEPTYVREGWYYSP